MQLKSKLKQIQHLDFMLISITLLSAFLNIFNIWKDKNANAYYTAAVTSMLQSWHNFFYASLDPGGYVTVDKPPVAFWIQTAFAYVLGVHGWSVILPQALAGVGSVLFVYFLVKPSFGKTAARLASLVMACTPIAVAVSRTNNIDSLLVFALLLATWMLFRGVSKQKLLWVFGAFAMIGVGFNIKMLQAYMVLPAFYLFYLFAFNCGWKKKIIALAAATAILIVVSASWAVVVDSIPEKNRPYIGGSQTNSVLELAFGYNGISRLKGMNRGKTSPGAPPDQRQTQQGDGAGQNQRQTPQQADAYSSWPGQLQQDGNNMPIFTPQAPQDGVNMPTWRELPRNADYRTDGFNASGFTPDVNSRQGQAPGRGGPPGQGGGMFGTGQAGPLRLFQSELSGQISWLMPFLLFAGVSLLAGLHKRKAALTVKQKETLFWLAWLLPSMAFFSVAEFFHQYYLIMLAPPIAALAGAGWIELWNQYQTKDGWKRWLLPAGLLATAAFELYILQPYQKQIGMEWFAGIGAAAIGLSLVLFFIAKKQVTAFIAAIACMLVLLVAPLYWAATPILYGGNSMLPQAGPSSRQGFGQRQGMGGGPGSSSVSGPDSGINMKLIEYTTKNNTGEDYLFMTTDTSTAESYIIETGKAVIAMGGFSGSDPILNVDKLKQMIAQKKVKFFLISSGPGPGGREGSSEVINWIRANSTEVPKEEWQDNSSSQNGRMQMGDNRTLYEINQ